MALWVTVNEIFKAGSCLDKQKIKQKVAIVSLMKNEGMFRLRHFEKMTTFNWLMTQRLHNIPANHNIPNYRNYSPLNFETFSNVRLQTENQSRTIFCIELLGTPVIKI